MLHASRWHHADCQGFGSNELTALPCVSARFQAAECGALPSLVALLAHPSPGPVRYAAASLRYMARGWEEVRHVLERIVRCSYTRAYDICIDIDMALCVMYVVPRLVSPVAEAALGGTAGSGLRWRCYTHAAQLAHRTMGVGS